MKIVGAFYALTLGAITWAISFFLTEYIETSPELYLFPGIISGLLNGLLIVLAINHYIKNSKTKKWFIESLLIGVIISLFNFALDFVVIQAFSRNQIVLLSYPMYIVFSLFGGYLTVRK